MILNCIYAIDGLHNPDAAIALAGAVNDWLIAEWLEQDPRLRASTGSMWSSTCQAHGQPR